MTNLAAPRPIADILALPRLHMAARLALASPFLISAVMKLVDFGEAMNEVAALGLRPAAPTAVAVILIQLGGSILFLTRRYCWLGAGTLAVFTAFATLLAHPFWTFDAADRARQAATFFEHVALVGGLALAALFVNGRSEES
ncbi:DoxX family protein [Microvirga subterranea]|uniref:Putative membrane protein YphA (DoxX/SURF4 family) n=1 Tax=Microvirga subterranea TaxID=186651 RepID=A0A370HP58_9HYPH|nr:DoxX family protein [Microvirga subterranea]RDI60015.1 putative membrane protein YphA (DoxX/SURF4 family) [Microvirga subterranea]